MSSWTIEPYQNPGAAREFSDKLARTLRRKDANLAPGFMTFDKAGAPFDSEEDFAYGQMLTIRKDGQPFFSGRRQLVDRHAAPRDEGLSYTLADPFWYCRIPYNKEWRDAGSPGAFFMHSRVLLMADPEGNPIHTGQQITSFLKYVLDNADHLGAPRPFDIGPLSTPPGATMPVAANIEVSVNVPWFETNGISCLQGVQKLAGYTPDMCGWFDHSTIPPKFHLKRYAALDTHTFAVGAPPLAAIPTLTACRDLQGSVAIVHFEVPTSAGLMAIVTRKYPTNASSYAWDRYEDAIRLAPDNQSYNIVSVTTRDITPAQAQWWLEHCPEYNQPNVIMGAPRYCKDLPGRFYVNDGREYVGMIRELVPGSPQPPDWSSCRALPQTYRCIVRVFIYDRPYGWPKAKVVAEEDVILSVNCTVTNAPYGTSDMREFGGGELGDAIPENLAKDFYDSLAMLHYKGPVVTIEPEVTGLCTLGSIAAFSNVAGELASARAMVQEVDWDIATGTITRSCGPPGHLGLGERWEIMRRSRFRIAQIKYEATTGRSFGGARQGAVAPGLQAGGTVDATYKRVTVEPPE